MRMPSLESSWLNIAYTMPWWTYYSARWIKNINAEAFRKCRDTTVTYAVKYHYWFITYIVCVYFAYYALHSVDFFTFFRLIIHSYDQRSMSIYTYVFIYPNTESLIKVYRLNIFHFSFLTFVQVFFFLLILLINFLLLCLAKVKQWK